MNKKIVCALVLSGLFCSVNAAVVTSFRWYNTAANNLQDHLNVNIAAGNATILTYLSTDTTVNYTGGYLSNAFGDDFFYKAVGTTLAGRLTGAYMTENDAPDYSGKYAYGIVLDMPYATFTGTYGGNVALVPDTTWYAVTTNSALSNFQLAFLNTVPTPGLPQTFGSTGSLVTNLQIPEPATALLFGIGGMGAWMLRRSKIKSQEEGEEADA